MLHLPLHSKRTHTYFFSSLPTIQTLNFLFCCVACTLCSIANFRKHVVVAEICGEQGCGGGQQEQPHPHRQELRRLRRPTRRPSRRRGRKNPSRSHCIISIFHFLHFPPFVFTTFILLSCFHVALDFFLF